MFWCVGYAGRKEVRRTSVSAGYENSGNWSWDFDRDHLSCKGHFTPHNSSHDLPIINIAKSSHPPLGAKPHNHTGKYKISAVLKTNPKL